MSKMSETDLYYFYESDFNTGSLMDFYKQLPNKNVKEIFMKAMGGVDLLDRDSSNVIQGYRGHGPNGDSGDSEQLAESNGIQEIRFWWGVSKQLHWFPIAGTIVWCGARIAGDTDWHSIYFDSETGAALSHDINEAAAKLNDVGLKHFNNGRLDKAMNYFKNAYHHSTIKRYYDEYKANQSKVEDERRAQNLSNEGQRFFDQGRFGDAAVKFQEAYSLSRLKNEYEIYEQKREMAASEREAETLNSRGDDLLQQGLINEACANYQAAYEKSKVKARRDVYKANRDRVQTDVEAAELFNRAKQLWNAAWSAEHSEQFDDAESKFQRAFTAFTQASDLSVNNNLYKIWKTASSLKIEGNQLFNEGLELQEEANRLWHRQKYEQANRKYQEAEAKFQEALTSTGDERFNDCIEIVKQSVFETRDAISRLNRAQSSSVFAELNLEDRRVNGRMTEEEIVQRDYGQQVFVIEANKNE